MDENKYLAPFIWQGRKSTFMVYGPIYVLCQYRNKTGYKGDDFGVGYRGKL